jgi:hypothetical protein
MSFAITLWRLSISLLFWWFYDFQGDLTFTITKKITPANNSFFVYEPTFLYCEPLLISVSIIKGKCFFFIRKNLTNKGNTIWLIKNFIFINFFICYNIRTWNNFFSELSIISSGHSFKSKLILLLFRVSSSITLLIIYI